MPALDGSPELARVIDAVPGAERFNGVDEPVAIIGVRADGDVLVIRTDGRVDVATGWRVRVLEMPAAVELARRLLEPASETAA